jgi:hypothetical protein
MYIQGIPKYPYEHRRLAEIRSEIGGRLVNVTALMSAEARNELLSEMALRQWNSERREATPPPRTCSIDRAPKIIPPDSVPLDPAHAKKLD